MVFFCVADGINQEGFRNYPRRGNLFNWKEEDCFKLEVHDHNGRLPRRYELPL